MIILGIDPGSRHTGYGVIEIDDRQQRLVEYGVLNLDVTADHALRLKQIYDRLSQVVDRCLPDDCGIEMPIYGRNPQSMLKLGRAQAAAMLAVVNRQIPATHYTPKEVKKAVTGNGNASKEQVWYMVKTMLAIDEAKPEHGHLGHDASDALAVALCHARRQTHTRSARAYTDWASFLRAHPDRIS